MPSSPSDYPDPSTVDWQALSHARQSSVSGIAFSLHIVAQAIDDLGAMLAEANAKPWTPISDRVPSWPDERDPRFRKEPGDGTV